MADEDEELDYGDEELPLQPSPVLGDADAPDDDLLDWEGDGEAAGEEALPRAGSMTPPASPQRAGAGDGDGAAGRLTPAVGEAVPEEWQVMEVPQEWRPRPMIRAYGLPAATTEEELLALLEAQQLGASVRSVVFDPRQSTPARKVALVRFASPALPGEPGGPDASATEPDAGKLALDIIAKLRAAAPEVHGATLNVEKTGAEVCLFLANLSGDQDSDEGLRAACEPHGALERCFVMRSPSGELKQYGFVEFALASSAAACREAWNREAKAAAKLGERVKLRLAEPAPIKTVSGLFGSVLFVAGLSKSLTDTNRLRPLFAEFGEITKLTVPRDPNNTAHSRGFAFVHFKHSFAADAAFRMLDGTEHEGIGKLLLSFSNPVKAQEALSRPASAAQRDRPTSQQQRDRPGVMQPDRGGRSVNYPAAGQRSTPPTAPLVIRAGGMPVILPAGAVPPPPPGQPPLMVQQQQAAAAMQQRAMQQQVMQQHAAMQQQAAMQQMMMMQQAAMQQAMLQQQQQHVAAAELQRKQKEEQDRKAAEEKRRKEQEEEEKKRREAEYSARLGYGGLGGMPAAAGGGMAGFALPAGFLPPAMAAMLPGFASMAGMAAMGGTAMGGTAAATGAGAGNTAGAAAEGSGRGGGGGYQREPAAYDAYAGAYGASARASYDDSKRDEYGDAGRGSYAEPGRGGYSDSGRDAYGDAGRASYADAGRESERGGGRRARGGQNRRGGGGGGGSGYGAAAEPYEDVRGGGGKDRSRGGYAADEWGSSGGRAGFREEWDSSRGRGSRDAGGAGGGKRDTTYGSVYGDSYSYPPKRPRY